MLKQMTALGCGLLLAGAALAAGDSAPAGNEDLNAKLAEARARLESAAREVAQLSTQLSATAVQDVRMFRTRAVLGLQLQTEPAAKDRGVRIIGVSPGGPAEEAGVRRGDVIVALDGEPMTGPDAAREIVERMAAVAPDSKVALKVLRDGKARSFEVTARPMFRNFVFAGQGPQQPFSGEGQAPAFDGNGFFGCNAASFLAGVELAPLSPHLGEYFGARQGVLVVHAAQLGMLQDGDVILDIDGRVPQNGSHATRILCSYQPGEKIRLDLMRQKKPLAEFFIVPEHAPGGDRNRSAPAAPAPPAAQAPAAPPAAGNPPLPPPANILPRPAQPDDGGCLNPRPPQIDPMPGSQVPCIRLPPPHLVALGMPPNGG